MKIKLLIVYSMVISACENSSRKASQEVYFNNDNPPLVTLNDEQDGKGGYDYDNTDSPNIGNIRLTGYIETCNKCMGYGSEQDGLYGQPQICKFCWMSTYMRIQQGWTDFDGRFGQVDAVFNSLPADYFDELNWNAGGDYDDNSGGASADQIEAEIARHEQNIAQLEHQLEYIEGSVNRSHIQQQIVNERYEIKRLKALLN